MGHEGEVYNVQFSSDETSVYTMGKDGKFSQWSVMKSGEKVSHCVQYVPRHSLINLFPYLRTSFIVLVSTVTVPNLFFIKGDGVQRP